MNDKELENLIEAYADTVRAVCRKYYLIGGSEDDLFQEGMIGLVEACRDFDKSKGDYQSDAFKKFAMVCIKRQIFDAIKKSNTKKNKALNDSVSLTQKNNSDEEFEIDFANFGSEENPEQNLLKHESNAEQLNKLYSLLSASESRILELYLEGLTQKKIASVLCKKTKQIDNAIQRIKRKAQIAKNENS